MIIYNLLLVSGFLLLLGLIYSYIQDTRKGTIPQVVVFASFGVGYLIKILSLILERPFGDSFVLYVFVTFAFIAITYSVSEDKIGGGDLKLYLAIYLITSNIYLLLFIILISNTFGYIEARMNKQKKVLFAKHILISYALFYVIALYQGNVFFLF